MTLSVSLAGDRFACRVQAQLIRDPVPSGTTDQTPSMVLQERAQRAVQVVEHVAEAVRPVDGRQGLAHPAAAVGEHDDARLTDGAPVVRLVGHLADRWEARRSAG